MPVASPVQRRSRVKRDALLRAAIELFSEGGVRGVTHRAVAQRAGVPAATTTYYFASIQDLVDEALALHVAERAGDLEALTAGLFSADHDPLTVARRFATDLVARRADIVVAQFEIYLEASRNPALRGPVGDALDRFEGVAADALRRLGVLDPERAAIALLALVDGFALHRVARPRPTATEVDGLVDAIVDLLAQRLPAASGSG